MVVVVVVVGVEDDDFFVEEVALLDFCEDEDDAFGAVEVFVVVVDELVLPLDALVGSVLPVVAEAGGGGMAFASVGVVVGFGLATLEGGGTTAEESLFAVASAELVGLVVAVVDSAVTDEDASVTASNLRFVPVVVVALVDSLATDVVAVVVADVSAFIAAAVCDCEAGTARASLASSALESFSAVEAAEAEDGSLFLELAGGESWTRVGMMED